MHRTRISGVLHKWVRCEFLRLLKSIPRWESIWQQSILSISKENWRKIEGDDYLRQRISGTRRLLWKCQYQRLVGCTRTYTDDLPIQQHTLANCIQYHARKFGAIADLSLCDCESSLVSSWNSRTTGCVISYSANVWANDKYGSVEMIPLSR